MKLKKFTAIICLAALLSVLLLSGCGNGNGSKSTENSSIGELSEGSCTVLFTMEDGQSFTIQCFPEYAPETVENFLTLVDSGFYDGLTFHRVLDNFVAQGGDPKGNGTGGSDNKIKGEFSENSFTQNTLVHKRGSVAMARSNDPDSASSQFYICYQDLPSLDGKYAVFGEVTDGMEVIDSFLDTPRSSKGTPQTPITIQSAVIVD